MIAIVQLDAMTLDLLVWKVFGRQDDQLVERALSLNPGLASAGTILPIGTEVELPDPEPPRPRIRDSVRLWS